ncbi:MAG: protein kinase domain-containing protein [Christensenellaceae bacterium]
MAEGTMLNGRYRLQKLLAEGGMSLVFTAWDAEADEVIAMKVLKPDLVEEAEYAKAFEKEADVLAKLEHENIVRIREADLGGKLKYFTMDYIEGITLKEALQQDVLSLEEKVTLVMHICDALEYAHKMGVVHQDMKPENIMLRSDMTPVITDFGIADTYHIDEKETKEVFGTVHYFSPEQAKGEETDRSTDVYALGVILYEMVTGELPFTGEDGVGVALKHLHQAPRPPIEINEALPESLNRIILKALRKEKNRRYRTMADMKKDLQKAFTQPKGTYVTGYVERENIETRRSQKRIKLLTGAIFAGATVLIILLGFIILNAFGVFDDGQSKKLFVPSLVDKTLEEAQTALEKAELKYEFQYESHPDVEENKVVSQMPEAGTEIEKGGMVTVIISTQSTGVDVIHMPNVTEMTEEKATLHLTEMGIKDFYLYYRETVDAAPEAVTAQYPKEGVAVEYGIPVIIVINKSSTIQTEMPKLTGRSMAEAYEIAYLCGFEAVYFQVTDTGEKEGQIVAQNHKAGEIPADYKSIVLKVQEHRGDTDVEGTVTYRPSFSEKSTVRVTATVRLDAHAYEIILMEDSFADRNAFTDVYPKGIPYSFDLGEAFHEAPIEINVYLNDEVVYTK